MRKLLSVGFASMMLVTTNVVQAEVECHGPQILREKNCVGDGLEPKEATLYEMINAYRAEFGLPKIPFSPSLTMLANRHVRDLEENVGFSVRGWSDCSYNPHNPATLACIQQAPQRLGTAYPGAAFELTYATGYKVVPEAALHNWQQMSHTRNILLSPGNAAGPWAALGVGIHKGYAVVWLGNYRDPVSSSEMSMLPTLGDANAVDANNHPLTARAAFSGGLSIGNGPFVQNVTVKSSDVVTLQGSIIVSAGHVGQLAKMIAYAAVTPPGAHEPSLYYMVDDKDTIQPWDKKPAHLVPFMKDVILPVVQKVKLYTGKVMEGKLQVYFGYRLADGTSMVNKQPIEFMVVK